MRRTKVGLNFLICRNRERERERLTKGLRDRVADTRETDKTESE